MTKIIDSCNKDIKSASVELVLSNEPTAKGLNYAIKNNIKTEIVNHKDFDNREHFDENLNDKLKENNIEFICNAGFMRILGKNFVNNWFNKQLNIHPSLLPSFKGLDIHKRVINSGSRISGCTVHLVRAGVDEGPIIAQAATYVSPYDNEKTLEKKVLELEHILYPFCLKLFSEGNIIIKEDKVIYNNQAVKELEEIQKRFATNLPNQ